MHSSHGTLQYEFRGHRWFSEAVLWDVWSLPSERSGHRMTYYDGCLYVFGGYNPTTKADDPTLSADPYWKESKPLFKQVILGFLFMADLTAAQLSDLSFSYGASISQVANGSGCT
jgi:hypothetical protein